MKIQLLKPWGMATVGQILPNVGAGVAEQLIKRGVAKCVDAAAIRTKPYVGNLRNKAR